MLTTKTIIPGIARIFVLSALGLLFSLPTKAQQLQTNALNTAAVVTKSQADPMARPSMLSHWLHTFFV